MNPVRAGLARQAHRYRFSSHLRNAFGAPMPLIEPHGEYLALGSDDERRQSAYRRLSAKPLPDVQIEAIRCALRSNLPIGSEAFLESLEQQFGVPMTRRRAGRRRSEVASNEEDVE
jgi:putative transposase